MSVSVITGISGARFTKNRSVIVFKRADFVFSSVGQDDQPYGHLLFVGADRTPDFNEGDVISFNTDDDEYHNITGKVVDVTFGSGNTFVSFDTLLPNGEVFGGGSGWVVNHTTRKDWQLLLNFKYTSEFNADILIEPLRYASEGCYVYADIQPFLDYINKKFANPAAFVSTNAATYSRIVNEIIYSYAESYGGSIGSFTDSSSPIFCYDGGLQPYHLQQGIAIEDFIYSGSGNVKPLSMFKKIPLWKGWPSYVSLLTDDSNTVRCIIDNSSVPEGSFVDKAVAISNYDIEGRLRDVCNNPVMLMSYDLLGGAFSWVFEGRREVGYRADGTSTLIVSARGLTEDEFTALCSLIHAGHKGNTSLSYSVDGIVGDLVSEIPIKMIYKKGDGTFAYQFVTIDTDSIRTLTSGGYYIEFEIQMPALAI